MRMVNFAAYAKSSYIMGDKPYLRITKTSLTSDFDYCPKQYEYKRIHQLPEPKTDAMTKGINVHNAIEEYYINVIDKLDELISLMKHGRKEEAIELAMSVIGEPESPYILGEEEVIRNRLSMDLDRLLGAGKENYLPIMNEEEVHAFVEETIEFNGEELTIPVHYAGSIDRGFKTEEGRVAIMELKTGKWMQTKKPMQDEWNDSTYKVQSMRTEMAYYKFLLEAADHDYQDVSHWGWVYPAGKFVEVPTFNKYGNEQRSVDNITYETASGRRDTDYRKKIDRLKEALLIAYLTEEFPTKPSQGKCAWCSFKSICPSWDGSDDPQEYRDKYSEE